MALQVGGVVKKASTANNNDGEASVVITGGVPFSSSLQDGGSNTAETYYFTGWRDKDNKIIPAVRGQTTIISSGGKLSTHALRKTSAHFYNTQNYCKANISYQCRFGCLSIFVFLYKKNHKRKFNFFEHNF